MIFCALNRNAIQIGNFSVKWYGVIMAVAIVLATWMSISEGKKRHIMSDDFVDFCAIASKGTILKQLLMELTTAIIDYSRFNLNTIQMLNE